MKIYLDAGHRNNQNDYGASGNGYKESELVLLLCQELKVELEKYGIQIAMSRESENEYLSLQERTNKANALGVDLYLCMHLNAFNGTATGVEVLYKNDSTLSNQICDAICNVTGLVNRRAKQRTDLHVLNATNMHAVLLEVGFIDNASDVKIVLAKIDEIVVSIAEIVANYLGVSGGETSILSSSTASVAQCKAWAKTKGATQTFIDNADIYYKLCNQVGVNPVMAYAQYAKESGYGKHAGVVDASYCNPCGLKVAEDGAFDDPNAHQKFNNWTQGITAHVDHLALYAGADGYPKQKAETPDPKHHTYMWGWRKTVESLEGTWAMSSGYADSILRMMNEIENTKVEETEVKGYKMEKIKINLNGVRKEVSHQHS